MSINVTKSETGWTITKNGTQYSVTDSNNNGKLDKEDLCKALSGDGNALTTDDFTEAGFKALELDDKMTVDDMAKYSKFKERKEAQEKAQKQQEQYMKLLQQPQQTQTKKRGFWSKLGQISTIVLGGASAALGAISGFGGGANAWAFNNTANDWAIRGFSGLSGGMLGMSTMMSALNPSAFGAGSTDYTSNLNQIMLMAQQENAQRAEQLSQWLNDYQEQAAEAKEKQKKEANVSGVKSLYEASQDNENEKVMDNANAQELEKIYEVGKESYSEEELNTAKKVKQYPHVPVNHISDKGSEATKLDPSVAKELNTVLGKYKNEKNESAKQDILTPDNYKKLKAIINKSELTEADITTIKNILKKPLQ